MPELPEYDIEGTGEMGIFDPVPAGEYICQVSDADLKITNSGKFQQLVVQWEIMDGEYAGRKIYDRINMQLPSVPWESLSDGERQAIDIGNRARKAMELATLGRCGARDSQEYIGTMAVLRIKIRPAKGEYPASNAVASYMPYQQQQAPQQQAAPAQQQHVAPAAPTTAAPTKPHPFAKRVFAKQP